MPDKSMKVCYFAAGFPSPAGIEAHVAHYACEMKKRGHDVEVRVFARIPREEHRFLKQLRLAGIEIASFGVPHWLSALSVLVPFPVWALWREMKGNRGHFQELEQWFYEKVSVLRFRAFLKNVRPDIIHIFGRLPGGAWKHIPAECSVYHEMMTGTDDGTWDSPERESFVSFANRCARLFAPGHGVAGNLKKHFPIRRHIDSIYTICPEDSAVDMEGENRVGADIRFGIVGRFVKQKGIATLLESLKCVHEKHGTVNFIFAGQGELESDIRDFIEKNSLHGVSVKRVGDSPCEILNSMDVFVHPSIDDAMPVSLAESLRHGVPVIASRVGGIPDLVRDGEEGVLIEPGSKEELIAGLERLIAMSSEEIAAYRVRARARYIEVCRPESVGDNIEEIYSSILRS